MNSRMGPQGVQNQKWAKGMRGVTFFLKVSILDNVFSGFVRMSFTECPVLERQRGSDNKRRGSAAQRFTQTETCKPPRRDERAVVTGQQQ